MRIIPLKDRRFICEAGDFEIIDKNKKHPDQDNDIVFEAIKKQTTIIKREGK